MTLQLRPDLFYASQNGHGVFLDLALDRYFLVSGATAEAIRVVLTGAEAGPNDVILVQPLLDWGWLIEGSNGSLPWPDRLPPAAMRDLPRSATEPSHLRVAAAIGARLHAGVELKCRSLQAIVTGQVSITHGGCSGPMHELRSDVALQEAAFARARTLFGARDQCLPWSVASWRTHARRGMAARLVFGIRTVPFAAHCWVQLDDMVLNDDVERVRQFVPIMASR